MDHIRAPPTNWHITTMNGHSIVTMKGQHTPPRCAALFVFTQLGK